MQLKKEHIGKVIKQNYIHDLADDFLQSAFDAIEEIKLLSNKRTLRRKIVSSCILSFLSLEAGINRLFFVTFKDPIQLNKLYGQMYPELLLIMLKPIGVDYL